MYNFKINENLLFFSKREYRIFTLNNSFMKIKDVLAILEELAPLSYAEDFDNVGLLVGDKNQDLTGVLVSLDTLEAVVDEAVENNCNLIVSFHPIVFSGLKKITGKTYVERVVIKAIQHNIAIFSVHTALDNSWNGVNDRICQQLQLENKQILLPKKDTLKKLITYVPIDHATTVREALLDAGAGYIGNYSDCSFNIEGTGSFRGDANANPVVGEKGELRFEKEIQISVVYKKHLESQILQALFSNHPYEEVAYEVVAIDNNNQHVGMGMIAEWKEPKSEEEFLSYLKDKMNTACVRHSALSNKPISKVAVLGGSGSFAIQAAIQAGADAFVTADLKYHDFFKAENNILLADIGHYESEQYTKNLLVSFLNKKISTFAVVLSQINTNPITYF